MTHPSSDFVPASTSPSGSNFISHYLGAKVASLRTLIGQIDVESAARSTLAGRLATDLDSSYVWIKNELLPLQERPLLWDRSFDYRRSQLEQRLVLLTTDRVRLAQEAWRDVAQLARERRAWLKQYWDLVQRMSFVERSGEGKWET